MVGLAKVLKDIQISKKENYFKIGIQWRSLDFGAPWIRLWAQVKSWGSRISSKNPKKLCESSPR